MRDCSDQDEQVILVLQGGGALGAYQAGFERYSAECLSRSPADAALHRHLGEVAGAARTLFERAVERLVAEEGLVLTPQGAPAAV